MKKEIKLSDEVTSVVRPYNKNGNSMYTTIPKKLVDILDIKSGDEVKWIYDIKKGKLYLDVDIISNDEK